MDITIHSCRYVPTTCSVRWLWLRRCDGGHGTAYTQNPMYLHLRNTTVSATLLPPLSIPLRIFRRLEGRKTGKIAPKSYSCHRDSGSRAVADRRAYTAKKQSPHRAGEAVLASCERMEAPSCKALSSITAMVTSISRGLSRMALIATRHASLTG